MVSTRTIHLASLVIALGIAACSTNPHQPGPTGGVCLEEDRRVQAPAAEAPAAEAPAEEALDEEAPDEEALVTTASVVDPPLEEASLGADCSDVGSGPR